MALYFDATVSLANGLNTGIQRVVCSFSQSAKSNELKIIVDDGTSEALSYNEIETHTLKLYFEQKKQIRNREQIFLLRVLKIARPLVSHLKRYSFLWEIKIWVNSRFLKSVAFQIHEDDRQIVRLKAKDTYITFDAFWNSKKDFERVVAASRLGARIVILVHDIFPLTNPEWFESSDIINFKKFFIDGVLLADLLIFSSNSSLRAFERQFPNLTTTKKVIAFGTDGIGALTDNHFFNEVQTTQEKLVLMIGTLEPRKNYMEVLSWREMTELNVKLVIVGRDGWKSGNVKRKILKLKMKGLKVIWKRSIPDAELKKLIAHANVGLCASLNEGYGLPLHEMINAGLPVVASDIEVFREIHTTDVRYFTLGNLQSLDAAVKDCLNISRFKKKTQDKSWDDAYLSLIEALKS
jgi:glycosyltransferase involved in cell wall biosynthesis